MHFLINELSFIGQAINDYKADELMESIFEIIKEISDIQNGDPLLTHSSLSSQKLSLNCTVKQWIYTRINSPKQKQETIAKIFLILLSKGPFIDLRIDSCKCYCRNQDVSSNALAGAAKLAGILISLQNAPNFADEIIEVEFEEIINSFENIKIKNLTEIKHARKLRPSYKFHIKHDPNKPWRNASPMDLTPEEAQKVLDQAVIYNLTDGTQYYGYYKDKFYEFQPGGEGDGTGKFDPDGYPLYHGYSIQEKELKMKVNNKIFSKLKNLPRSEE